MKNSRSVLMIALILSLLLTAQSVVSQSKVTSNLVSVDDAAKNALKAGGKMPAFLLNDSSGKAVASEDLLKKGNLVLVFYRGSWCPFCNLYLRSLQKRLKEITDAGGILVAVSVEEPDASMAVAKKNELQFTVLSDPKLETARKFGIVFQLPTETDELYKSRGLDVAEHNSMEMPELPLGATYVINGSGTVEYAFIETDYKKRAEPDVIIENLKKIRRKDNL